jgi:putative tributyrin esterase
VATVGTMQMFSRALAFPVTFTILLPEPDVVGPGPYHALVQLHGRFDGHTSWLSKSRLLDYIYKLPLIVVLPDGGNYLWADVTPFTSYETFVVQDLIDYVTNLFAVRKDSRWAIGGLSMGGFGALRLGLKYPDKFCSIYAHSSYIPTYDELLAEANPLGVKVPEDLDCYRVAERIKPDTLPSLGFDCGADDDLLEHNRRFDAHLDRLKLPHQYTEHPGAHDWAYWDRHVQTALRQHAEVLNIKPIAP